MTNTDFLDEDEADLSLGVGVGLKLGQVSLEVDYTTYNDFDMFSFTILF